MSESSEITGFLTACNECKWHRKTRRPFGLSTYHECRFGFTPPPRGTVWNCLTGKHEKVPLVHGDFGPECRAVNTEGYCECWEMPDGCRKCKHWCLVRDAEIGVDRGYEGHTGCCSQSGENVKIMGGTGQAHGNDCQHYRTLSVPQQHHQVQRVLTVWYREMSQRHR